MPKIMKEGQAHMKTKYDFAGTSISIPALTSENTNDSQQTIFEQISILNSKKLRLETDSDYATINSVGAVIKDLEKQILQLKIQAIEKELGKKITTVKKPNKTLYVVSITTDGKRKQISATSVEALYQKVIGRMLPASNSYNATVSVQDVFNLFSEHNHTPIVDNDGSITYPTSTAKRKDQYWNKYWANDILTTLPIQTVISGDIIDAFKRLTASRKYNARQIDQAKSVLKQTFDYAIWQKIITVNPVISLPNNMCPKKARNISKKKATSKDWRLKLEKHLKALPEQTVYSLAIRFWLTSMQRVGEWLAITWNDVDFEKETLTIKHSLSKREVDGKLVVVDDEHLKADEVAREIPLTDKALSILKELYLINGQKKYVFNSKGKLPISTNRVNGHIKAYCEDIGIEPMSTHAQRRGAIQEAYSMQMVEDQIRVTAGHADSTMTRYYNKQNNRTLSKSSLESLLG